MPVFVAAVQAQWEPGDYLSEDAYARAVRAHLDAVREKVPKGATTLVAFPEDYGTFLVFKGAPRWVMSAPTLDKAIQRLVLVNLPRVLMYKLRFRVSWVRALTLAKSDPIRRIHCAIFSRAAREYGFWIVAGTICVGDGGPEAYNECPVYSPEGELVLVQRKVHLIELEGTSGLDLTGAPLERLGTFEVDGKRVGVAICLDAFRDDVVSRLSELGMDILVQPSANPEKWSPEQQLDWMNGIWGAVARDGRAKWGLNPMLVGNLLGLRFEGQSSITSSIPVRSGLKGGYMDCPGYPGFVGVAKSPVSAEVLIADVG